MSSWHKYDLEPHGSLVEEVPPREDVSSDRPLSMSVPSLAADPGRIRLLEGLSREERNAILGAASYRRLSRHTVVTNQEERANHLFLLLKGSPLFLHRTRRPKNIFVLACVRRDIRRRDPSAGTFALSGWHRTCQRQLRARMATQHNTNSRFTIPQIAGECLGHCD